ncbi:MAG TPA: hypothetical protein VGQ86_10675 [Candidatus Limnocylindria bacterium]|jgi:hypothetical protein|nr:hypothetical protein [Candidatus Limnocylindria bacterium]
MPPRDDRGDLVRHTVTWIAVALWLLLGFAYQTPSGDPYTDTVRSAFIWVVAIVVPLGSLFILFAWIGALRRRH